MKLCFKFGGSPLQSLGRKQFGHSAVNSSTVASPFKCLCNNASISMIFPVSLLNNSLMTFYPTFLKFFTSSDSSSHARLILSRRFMEMSNRSAIPVFFPLWFSKKAVRCASVRLAMAFAVFSWYCFSHHYSGDWPSTFRGCSCACFRTTSMCNSFKRGCWLPYTKMI